MDISMGERRRLGQTAGGIWIRCRLGHYVDRIPGAAARQCIAANAVV
jgi:hypothetical protein